ncbi:MAG: hypothetical protein JOY82_07290 [Streptosporangiaceae bacterium]|nr:hypothetical protein [Streptosporangiaceae bacterium]MBV9854319.1 hypothetical protein [Streptosporangiaceae bacterium]
MAKAVEADWRVTVQLYRGSRGLASLLRGRVAGEMRERLGQLATVSAGDLALFAYAGTEAAASEAVQVALELTARHGVPADVRVHRWHPASAEWDDDPRVVSMSASELAEAIHRRRVAEDTERTGATGVFQWTVRVTLPSRRAAAELAGQLTAEGLPLVRRRRSVVLGASNEDAARDLAQRIAGRGTAADVRVERVFAWSPPVEWAPLF